LSNVKLQSRHVRAIAVFGIAVIALTGARGSHGGGCSSSSSSSSSASSSGGGTTGDVGKDDYSSGSDGGTTTTTGGTGTSGTTGSSSGSSSSKRAAARDLKIETCTYDNGLVARVRATNSSSITTYSYKFDVEFTDGNGKLIPTAEDAGILSVPADSSDTLDVKVPQSAMAGGDFTVSGGSCKLTDPERYATE
jgi:hypothetical protein